MNTDPTQSSGDDPVKVELLIKVTTCDGTVTTLTVPHIDLKAEGSEVAMRVQDAEPADERFIVIGKSSLKPERSVPQRMLFAVRGILIPDDNGQLFEQVVEEENEK